MARLHILLAEDNSADAALVRAALAEGKFQCTLDVAETGETALAHLRGQVPGTRRPDVVLLDLTLAGISGFELLRQMKADPDLLPIPVVVLTASDQAADVTESYNLGAAGYVTKPTDAAAFFTAIHGIEEYWFAVVRRPKKA